MSESIRGFSNCTQGVGALTVRQIGLRMWCPDIEISSDLDNENDL
jgi:hypothetical protein